MYEILCWQDNVFGIFYILILSIFILIFGVKKIEHKLLKKFYLFAFLIRIFSAYFYIFLYKVVIGSVTDTGRYYDHSYIVRNQLINNTFDFSSIDWTDSTQLTGIFAGFISLITPSNYLAISFIFTTFGFIGSWLIYITFLKIYPNSIKQLAFVILFLPSIFFWGAALLKDPLSLFGLGLLFYSLYNILIKYKLSISNFILFIFGIIFSAFIKAYIPLIFIPCMFFLVYKNFMLKIKFRVTKFFLFPVIAIVLLSITYFGVLKISEINTSFSAEKAGSTIQGLQKFYLDNPEFIGGSAYDIGTISSNMAENISILPSAFIVTFFRPYLWEAKKILYIPSLYESLLSFYFIFYFIFKIGIFKIIRIIRSDIFLQFCLIFSVIFGIVVGLSSFNFGTLMRYKIPCLPFWFTFLIIIYQKYKDEKSIQENKFN